VVVKGVRLHQIDNVEAVWDSRPRVRHFEVVPLRVAPGIVIGLQDNVVLVGKYLNRAAQVS
jgi:hypothetical protein